MCRLCQASSTFLARSVNNFNSSNTQLKIAPLVARRSFACLKLFLQLFSRISSQRCRFYSELISAAITHTHIHTFKRSGRNPAHTLPPPVFVRSSDPATINLNPLPHSCDILREKWFRAKRRSDKTADANWFVTISFTSFRPVRACDVIFVALMR